MKRYLFYLLFALISVHEMQCTSLVYNIKIRRTFAGLAMLLHDSAKLKWVATIVPTVYWREAHIIKPQSSSNVFDKRIAGGALFNLRYVPSRHWWLEATTAVQRESVKTTGTSNFTASRAGFDDFVLAGGYNFFLPHSFQLSFYGLAGFPIRKKITPYDVNGPLVGIRFYGIGGGTELSYGTQFSQEQTLAAIAQLRVIYYFPRCWQPILPPGGRIQPGFQTDAVFSLRYRYKRTLLETGYNPTFYTGQATITPPIKTLVKPTVRHGVYVNVNHLCKRVSIMDNPLAVGAGLIYNRLGALHLNYIAAVSYFTVLF